MYQPLHPSYPPVRQPGRDDVEHARVLAGLAAPRSSRLRGRRRLAVRVWRPSTGIG